MTASSTLNKEFSDFCASRDAQNTIQLNVVKYTWQLCDALRQNYIDYSIRQHQRSFTLADNDRDLTYHAACIEDLRNGQCNYDFTFESGRKYHKVIMNTGNQRSVHCFIDKKTGGVFKSASWRSPAKGERFNLLLIKDREWLFKNADWSGSYLYK
jgi:hypothetical protein